MATVGVKELISSRVIWTHRQNWKHYHYQLRGRSLGRW